MWAHERGGLAGWAGAGKYPWQRCPTCKQPFTGELKLVLARAWIGSLGRRSTEPEAIERFAVSA